MAWTEDEMKVAQWMINEYNKYRRLCQPVVAVAIRKQFGEAFVHRNKQGHWGINKGVLAAFKRLTGAEIVWSRSTQMWRERQPEDPVNTRMVR